MSNDFQPYSEQPSQQQSQPAGASDLTGAARKMMPNDYPTSSGAAESMYGAPSEESGQGNPRRMMPNDYPLPVERRHTPIPLPVKLLGGCLATGVVLLLLLGCATAVVTGSIFAGPTVTSTTSQSFSVTGTPLIRLHNDVGDVTVQPGNSTGVQVRVEKHAQASIGGNSQSALNSISVTMNQSGSTIDIEVHASDGNFLLSHRWVNLTITTPATSNLDFTSSAGNVEVEGISGTMSLKSAAGNVTVSDGTLTSASTFQTDAGNVKLESVTANAHTSLRSDAGNITFDGSLGQQAALDTHTSAGNVTLQLPANTNAHLTATTNAGTISIDSTWSVPVNKDAANASANGDLGTGANPAATITVVTDAGNITIEPN
jgi:DUF4097 and DUF4098 domain-containing protein YvlB